MCLPAEERKRERWVEKRRAGPSGPYLQDIHVLRGRARYLYALRPQDVVEGRPLGAAGV